MKIIKGKIILLFALIVFLAACKSQGTVEFSDVWAPPGLKDGNSGVFFIVTNTTSADDMILSVSSDIAVAVEIHKTSMVDDIMKMEKQDEVLLPAGEGVNFEPGGLHVMLIGLHDDLKIGDEFTITLILRESGEISLDVIVREP